MLHKARQRAVEVSHFAMVQLILLNHLVVARRMRCSELVME